MNRRTAPRVFYWCSVLTSLVMFPFAAYPTTVVAREVVFRIQDQGGTADEFSEETHAAFAEIRNTFLSALKAKGLERKKLLDETYDRIVDVTSSNSELSPARTVWAKLLLSVGDQKAARQALQLATLELPRDPEAFILLANLASSSGQFGESRLLFDHALDKVARLAPDAPRRKGLLIQIYSGRSNVIEAQLRLAQSEKNESLAKQLAGESLEDLNRWVSLDSENPAVHERLGAALLRNGQADRAKQEFDQSRKLNPELPVTELRLARAYFSQGKADLARQELDRALAENGDDINVRLVAADLLMALGDPEEARRQIDVAIVSDPKSREGQLLDAQWHRFAQDWPKSKAILQKLHAQIPADFEIANLLALTLTECDGQGDSRRAVEMALVTAQRFSNLGTPAGRRARLSLVWALFSDDQRKAASDNLNQLLSVGLDSNQISGDESYYAARLFHDFGRPELALPLVNAALARVEEFPKRDAAEALQQQLTRD